MSIDVIVKKQDKKLMKRYKPVKHSMPGMPKEVWYLRKKKENI